jgi:hypothetical protein
VPAAPDLLDQVRRGRVEAAPPVVALPA